MALAGDFVSSSYAQLNGRVKVLSNPLSFLRGTASKLKHDGNSKGGSNRRMVVSFPGDLPLSAVIVDVVKEHRSHLRGCSEPGKSFLCPGRAVSLRPGRKILNDGLSRTYKSL